MTASEPKTHSEGVYASLRAELLGGSFLPGSKLKLAGIGTRYGVSLSVVREAMTRLAGEGLVRALPQRGFCVTPLSVDDLLDLTRARVLIETSVLRESIGQGGLEWESAVIAAHHTLQGTTYTTDEGHLDAAWSAAHQAFHRALLTGAKSPRLESIATELRDCSLLYQHWSIDIAGDLDRDVAAEHRNIAELAVARDAEGAVRALTEHIERTTAALLAYAESQTDPRRAAGISA
ncbi:GntR family transcriptional regulator [Arthrobacter sp. ISL-72]|uniref:GntR family transcriptional regulator n=1 Tax=Arthrobacter sp. ISL-72 TaxID=2819114 RepID=UPI001BE78127|nr:GntR family transcriptional regulator [Arthrobacter sp. ISL-72]MBT2597960.1 GntR family transcriptional regulator [Arthrobacter sp. ISL-72]